MSYAVRAPVSERAASTPLPVIAGKSGRDPAQVVQVHVGRDDLEVEQHGVARPGDRAAAGEPACPGSAPRDRLKTALSPRSRTRPTASRTVTAGIVDPGRERVQVDGERLRSGVAIRSRAMRVVRSDSRITRRRPSGLSSITRPGLARSAAQRRVPLGLGAERPVGIPRQARCAACRPSPARCRNRPAATCRPGLPFPRPSTSS